MDASLCCLRCFVLGAVERQSLGVLLIIAAIWLDLVMLSSQRSSLGADLWSAFQPSAPPQLYAELTSELSLALEADGTELNRVVLLWRFSAACVGLVVLRVLGDRGFCL